MSSYIQPEPLTKEQLAWFNNQPEKLSRDEATMVALSYYPNPNGIPDWEVRYRNLIRKLVKRLERLDWQLEVQRRKIKAFKRMGL